MIKNAAETGSITEHAALTVRAIVVPAQREDPIRVEAISVDRSALLGLVGDTNTETLFLDGGEAAVLAGAHAKADGAEINPRATQIAERFLPGFAHTDRIKGTALILGLDVDPDSDLLYTDVPSEVEEFATNMWGHRLQVV